MNKLKLHTPNFATERLEQLAALFPNCITETTDEKTGLVGRAIDFEQLRQELSDHIVDGPRERYHLDWPGKREALLAASAPIAKTLRPRREESVDFDTTKNLFIEGDNLDGLKLLQETYLGRIKMIYIDPPYNTGNDFIFDDDFAETADSFLRRSNQVDSRGNRMIVNTDANGRFHSDWLTMMYPRMKLARNLLRQDGVIFVSMDDHEIAGLRFIGDEIFGRENFVATFVWQKRYSRENRGAIGDVHEYIVCYARSAIEFKASSGRLPLNEEQAKIYKNINNDPMGRWRGIPMTAQGYRPNQMYEIVTPTGVRHTPTEGRCWSMVKPEYEKLLAAGRIYFGQDGSAQPQVIRYLSEVDGLTPWTWLPHDEVGHTDEAKKELYELMGKGAEFDTPKPVRLITRLLQIASKSKDFTVLDFFAGSGTTAHAVALLNSVDGGSRRCITVQVQAPNTPETGSGDYVDRSQDIAALCKERLRRSGRNILGSWSAAAQKAAAALPIAELSTSGDNLERVGPPDVGFRVLRIDTSNMLDVYYTPEEVRQGELLGQAENIKAGRTPEDLLFQVLVDWGVDLTLPIEQEKVSGKNVFFVDGNALVACFDPDIGEDLVRELTKRKPLRAVFRDSGYDSDSTKINVEQIFKLFSPETEVKSL